MSLTVNSDAAGAIGKAFIAASVGQEHVDPINELIGSLHIQIAELVRIYADSQRANRVFQAEIGANRENLSKLAASFADLQATQKSLDTSFTVVRSDVAEMAKIADGLNMLVDFTRQLSNAVVEHIQSSNAESMKMKNSMDAVAENLASMQTDLMHFEERVLVKTTKVDVELTEFKNAMDGQLKTLTDRDLLDHIHIAWKRIWRILTSPIRIKRQ